VTKNETKTEAKIEAKTEEAKPVATDDKTASAETPAADEQEVLNYYSNYLKEYRLGPNDVISVEVFGQCPDYCKNGITVPPTARISYPLVREGVMVGGRTVEQVADEITKKLDEYIIDPKVTVTLEKAMSARYSVMGKVNAPGIRILDRKVSLYEAVIEAGGVAKNGNKKKIALVRFDNQGKLTRQEVDLAAIESGKAPMIYLNPGDQVFVPGKGFTIDTFFDTLGKISAVRLLFGSPF
jgi:polysaccharide export outer membrane protein